MAFRIPSARPLSTVIALATVGVAGCVGPLVDEIQLDEISARTLRTDIAVYESSQLRELQYNVIGPVQATSCYNNFLTDKPATRNAAIDQMRLRTRQYGGNALANLICEPMRGTDLATNCWSSVTCYASAILVKVTDVAANTDTNTKQQIRGGTGFFVSQDGYAVTNAHVVQNCNRIIGQIDNEKFDLDLIAADNKNDLALMGGSRNDGFFARIGPARPLQKGEPVIALGYPLKKMLSSELKVTTGVISALTGPGNDISLFQTTAALQPGNSGGPLINEEGDVVGIATSKIDAIRVAALTGDIPSGISFGIKSDVLKIFLESNRVAFTESKTGKHDTIPSIVQSAEKFTFPVYCINE